MAHITPSISEPYYSSQTIGKETFFNPSINANTFRFYGTPLPCIFIRLNLKQKHNHPYRSPNQFPLKILNSLKIRCTFGISILKNSAEGEISSKKDKTCIAIATGLAAFLGLTFEHLSMYFCSYNEW